MAYLTKPIKASEVCETLLRALGQTGGKGQPPRDQAAEQRKPGPLRVLLAEDGLVNQKLAVALLKKRGHEVTVAQNGQEAVQLAQTEPFDVILMDVEMPEMDGFQATAAIRQREKALALHTPIIAMTAHAMKGDRERCLAAGMDAYVAKPIRPAELFAAIESLVPGRPAQQTAAAAPGGALS
jgi:CheY-like chemotaxis protein